MSQQRVIVTGATGMIGGLALRLSLENPGVSSVTAVGRRSPEVEHAELRDVRHDNFLDFTAVAEALTGQDVALYCLGAYSGAVPDDEFRRVTVDYTLAFARALYQGSPRASFCFLSGQGADQTERSRMAFARYKGEAERELVGLGFRRVHLFRPGYIYPVTRREEPNVSYRMMRSMWPVLRRLYPNAGIPSDDLARAMVFAGLYGTEGHEEPVLDNRAIRALAARAV